jgi:hypothetical protein
VARKPAPQTEPDEPAAKRVADDPFAAVIAAQAEAEREAQQAAEAKASAPAAAAVPVAQAGTDPELRPSTATAAPAPSRDAELLAFGKAPPPPPEDRTAPDAKLPAQIAERAAAAAAQPEPAEAAAAPKRRGYRAAGIHGQSGARRPKGRPSAPPAPRSAPAPAAPRVTTALRPPAPITFGQREGGLPLSRKIAAGLAVIAAIVAAVLFLRSSDHGAPAAEVSPASVAPSAPPR